MTTNFPNKENQKNACISKTVRGRAISTKFLTHRVSLQIISFFQKFVPLKMVTILNFRFFYRNAKHKNACISKTVLDSDFDEICDPQGIWGSHWDFFPKLCLAKNGSHFEFFAKIAKR